MKKAKPVFDFETPYQKFYPRKGEGKTKGMNRLKETITTKEQYDQWCIAIENYAKLCEQENRPKEYIKMFVTFVNNWQDYVSAEDLGLMAKPKLALVFE